MSQAGETIEEAAARLVAEQRAEQGLPVMIEDASALAWLAERLREHDGVAPPAHVLDMGQRQYVTRAALRAERSA